MLSTFISMVPTWLLFQSIFALRFLSSTGLPFTVQEFTIVKSVSACCSWIVAVHLPLVSDRQFGLSTSPPSPMLAVTSAEKTQDSPSEETVKLSFPLTLLPSSESKAKSLSSVFTDISMLPFGAIVFPLYSESSQPLAFSSSIKPWKLPWSSTLSSESSISVRFVSVTIFVSGRSSTMLSENPILSGFTSRILLSAVISLSSAL